MFALHISLCLLPLVLPAQQVAGGSTEETPFVVVLGVAQDGGYPHAGCHKDCCAPAWGDPARWRNVVCLGIVDPKTRQHWMLDATPDFRQQLRMLDVLAAPAKAPTLSGILLTHGHIGHYTGLMFLGHESMGAKGVPVYAMPRMQAFLSNSGPWDQLLRHGNIELRALAADTDLSLNERITVTPFVVPHREEYTEVVGFRIEGPSRSVLFIPDIDKWERWNRRIEDVIADVDVAYLDGTFYANGEVPSRDMSQIPHPFIVETLQRFKSLPASERNKVRFIHFNHTNPALNSESEASHNIERSGLHIARQLERFPL